MSIKSLRFRRLCPVGLLYLSMTIAGCSGGAPQWSGSGFIRKDLLAYKGVAVLPFQDDAKGEASDTFAEDFHEKFPQIALVGRGEVLSAFQEQDVSSGLIDEATRRKIGRALGVQALIVGNVYYPSIVRWLLQIQVIDVETGEIMGRSVVEINYVGAEGVKDACRIAVKNLAQRQEGK